MTREEQIKLWLLQAEEVSREHWASSKRLYLTEDRECNKYLKESFCDEELVFRETDECVQGYIHSQAYGIFSFKIIFTNDSLCKRITDYSFSVCKDIKSGCYLGFIPRSDNIRRVLEMLK